ncbi:MAG: hypothetical protein IK130_11815 [Oscillospiraceae bacterium]|nr:hypothetical protein [Oscillospiraceae bacterium]
MKHLKYEHPFCGHDYPQAIIAGCLIAGLLFAIVTRQNTIGFLISLFLPPIAAVSVMLYIFQRLTPEERLLTKNAEAPVWASIEPDTLRRIRSDAKLTGQTFWQNADASAESAVISVHHRYDVTHKIRLQYRPNRTVIEHLLVCYLPDGRYIITAPFGCENADKIRLVRFGGKVCCTEYKAKEKSS